jgi:hypothetical protein
MHSLTKLAYSAASTTYSTSNTKIPRLHAPEFWHFRRDGDRTQWRAVKLADFGRNGGGSERSPPTLAYD